MTKKRTRRELIKAGLLAEGAVLVGMLEASASGQGPGQVGVGEPNPDLPPNTLFYPDGIPMDLEVHPSPATSPFTMDLPIPPIAVPVRGNDGELVSGHENLTDAAGTPQPKNMANPSPEWGEGRPDLRPHQRWDEFVPQKYYQVNCRLMYQNYHDDLTALSPGGQGTLSFGYHGIIPGPTFITFYGEPILVRMANGFPACNSVEDFPVFGIQSITAHLHNAHTASESDGFPMDFIDPGQWHDHHYVQIAAGDDWRERMSSLWYHDHRMDFTAPNVYAGLSGFFFIFDKLDDTTIARKYKDTGDERDGGTLRFPGQFVYAENGDIIDRKYDIPFMIHDVLFDAQGQAVFDVFNTDGILGDKWTINRVVQPKCTVERRRYRLRIQNGGPSRFYKLFLTDGNGDLIPGLKMWVISSEGNILNEPLAKDSIEISVAQRHDVIVDFSKVPQNIEHVYLYNSLEQIHGRGPTNRNLRELDPNVTRDGMLRFDLVPAVGVDHSKDPATVQKLREFPDDYEDLMRLRFLVTTATPSDYGHDSVEVPTIHGTETHERKYLYWVDGNGDTQKVYIREMNFDYDGGLFTVNNMVADMTEIPVVIEKGALEVWRIRNDGGDWSHPVHIHFEEFRLIDFNGKPMPADDPRFGRKDVLTILPNDVGLAFFRFRDFEGHYIIHCHNVVHEDHAMMIRWNIGLNRDVGHHTDEEGARFCNGVYIPEPEPMARECQ